MEEHIVKIKSIGFVTHDVLQIVTEKPGDYRYDPGQATEISINKRGWEKESRPFTFTSLPDKDFLQFTIKTYPERNGVTNELRQLKAGDELILHEVFGAIAYKGEGVFVAGGAGVTPFICILRHLQTNNRIGNNKLIFANKTKADIILRREFDKMLGENFINILSKEKTDEYAYGHITEAFLWTYVQGTAKPIYLCGPPPMMEEVEKQLASLHIDGKLIVKEAV